MSKKKKVPAMMEEKAHHIGWPGYQGPMTWGKLFTMQWPDEHPDTHCEAHAFTPDDSGMCECKWVAVDRICCEKCNELLRDKIEQFVLYDIVKESRFRQEGALFIAYMAYCKEYADELTCTPVLEAVIEWFNSLSEKARDSWIDEYHSKWRSMDMMAQMPDLDDLMEGLEGALTRLMRSR